MLRVLSRLMGYWLVAAAVLTMVIDAAKSVAEAKFTFTPFKQTIDELDPTRMSDIQNWFETKVGIGLIWSALEGSVFLLPTWILLGALGGLFLFWGRRKRRVDASQSIDASYG